MPKLWLLVWPAVLLVAWARRPDNVSPYILYGPHGYNTYPHSRCQEVPTEEVEMSEISGEWFLTEYIASHDGKPSGLFRPYLCPESKMQIDVDVGEPKMNISQLSYEWPVMFMDRVEWVQNSKNKGVFFHEEGIFALWTMKVMEAKPDSHLVLFHCIDYTIWPGWNHRGVYILSRQPKLQEKVKRKLSPKAHRRMRMYFDRKVNTTTCDPDEWMQGARERWHPHRKINRELYQAPVHPYMSRKHRRRIENLD